MVADYFKAGILVVDAYVFLIKKIQIQNVYINTDCKIIMRESTHLRNLSAAKGRPSPGGELIDFYNNETVHQMDILERMLVNCDETDMNILRGLMAEATYEQIAESSCISVNTVKYRLKKMGSNLKVKSRKEIVDRIRAYDLEFDSLGRQKAVIYK
jgi:DNA-binding NarL/FixJ family response regulator